MRSRLNSWWKSIWNRKWWFLFILGYKIIEDWSLGKLTAYIEENKGILVSISQFIVDYLPWLTWLAIPVVIILLLTITWRQSQSGIIPKAGAEERNIVGVTKVNQFVPKRLEHDGVIWEEAHSWNSYYAAGPLCPKDYTPLVVIDSSGRIDTHPDHQTSVGYYRELLCMECQTRYKLGEGTKTIGQSESEAGILFEGKRKREQQGED